MPAMKYPTTVDLSKLLDGPRARTEIDATRYACELAERDGLITTATRPHGGARGVHYKLTAKGRRKARKA